MTRKRSSKKQDNAVIAALTKKHSAKLRADIVRGVTFCRKVWKGTDDPFMQFCLAQYCPPGEKREALARTLDGFFNALHGGFSVMGKIFRRGVDIADSPLTPADELLGAFSAATHVTEDLREFSIAALVQLNFGTDSIAPVATRVEWLMRRLSLHGTECIPAPLMAESAKASAAADTFISGFNLHLDRIEFIDASVTFPPDTVQVSHWGLRDYMTSLNGQEHALPRQHAIRDLMRRVVDGEIPREMIEDPSARWRQRDNTILIGNKRKKATMTGALRYEYFKRIFDVQRRIDPYTKFGSIIDNKFKRERELSEERVVDMLTAALDSPAAKGAAQFVSTKLKRPLEPHDIYFKDFRGGVLKEPLSFNIRERYPNAAALTRAIPDILAALGFTSERASFIGSKIRVDNARSAGHAWPPGTPADVQLLRVRIDANGISEQDFGVFMHELGHCVEGVLSSFEMDHKTLWGIPNTAFTEGFAFTFQDRADMILGRADHDDHDVTVLLRFWELFEIAGPALTEIEFFHWLYTHPRATAPDMHKAIRRIGDSVWKRYYAPIFGAEGYGLMSVYSHVLWCTFYLADYPLGYIIAYQIRKYLSGKDLGTEMQRMCRIGCIYPDIWMHEAVHDTVSIAPLLDDAMRALSALGYTE